MYAPTKRMYMIWITELRRMYITIYAYDYIFCTVVNLAKRHGKTNVLQCIHL